MDSTASTPHTPPAHTEPLHISDEQSTALLSDTLNLLGEGLPNADGASGLHELERWEAVLEASDRPGLAKVCQEIKLLRERLEASDTLNLLGEGLPNADGASGLHELERWEAVLEASDRPGLAKVCQEIKLLRERLSAADTQAHEIAEILASLGAETQKVSEEAANGYSDALHKLSRVLIKASNLLSR